MKEIDPVYLLVIVIIMIVSTWFVSYSYTINTLDVQYDPDTNYVWVMDCYGNLEHYGTPFQKEVYVSGNYTQN